MKKIIFRLLILSFLFSCDNSLDNFEGAKVTYMNSWDSIRCRYECTYKQDVGYQAIFFVDSCGKYKIGDTVHLQKLTH